jgi:hypothetical protein
MTFAVTTFNWRGTGQAHSEVTTFRSCFQDMKIGQTRINFRYAITRIS